MVLGVEVNWKVLLAQRSLLCGCGRCGELKSCRPLLGHLPTLQPFSQKSRTPTVAKEFQIGLYHPAEADLELFRNSWSARFLGERL